MDDQPGGLAATDTDEALLAAVAAGNRDAFRILYQRHAPWLALRLARCCADRDLVDDALQDTFVAVWRRAVQYRGQGAVAAWLWSIALRRLIDRLRRRQRLHLPLGVSLSLRDRAVEVSAEERVLLGVEFGDLAEALNGLSPELRAVLQLTVLDGLSTRETARLLGIPTGTVKTRAMRARARLREELA